MLSIFKSYSAKTSLLDDFMFYEDREKSLRAKRSSKPALQNDVFKKDDISVSLQSLDLYTILRLMMILYPFF